MDEFIDLHTHSSASDGSMSPRELVRHGKELGLAAIAITDHDTVDGVADALDEGRIIGLEVIPGVEISVSHKPEMHILGYFFGNSYEKIRGTLDCLIQSRNERNPKMIRKLNEMGFDITMEEVEEEAGGNVVARPHVASVLMKKGYIKNVAEAFEKYLSFGKPAYFPKDRLTPEQGIRRITEAGGIPVLAHPVYLYESFGQMDKLLEKLVSDGLKGMEAYYAENSLEDTGNLLRLAIKHKLLVTGGSDFHGNFKPGLEMGFGHGNLRVPYHQLVALKDCYNKAIEG